VQQCLLPAVPCVCEVLQADLGYIWSSVLSVLNLSLETTVSVLPSAEGAGLSTSAICPMHGPLVRSSLTELVREYKQVRPPLVCGCWPLVPRCSAAAGPSCRSLQGLPRLPESSVLAYSA